MAFLDTKISVSGSLETLCRERNIQIQYASDDFDDLIYCNVAAIDRNNKSIELFQYKSADGRGFHVLSEEPENLTATCFALSNLYIAPSRVNCAYSSKNKPVLEIKFLREICRYVNSNRTAARSHNIRSLGLGWSFTTEHHRRVLRLKGLAFTSRISKHARTRRAGKFLDDHILYQYIRNIETSIDLSQTEKIQRLKTLNLHISRSFKRAESASKAGVKGNLVARVYRA